MNDKRKKFYEKFVLPNKSLEGNKEEKESKYVDLQKELGLNHYSSAIIFNVCLSPVDSRYGFWTVITLLKFFVRRILIDIKTIGLKYGLSDKENIALHKSFLAATASSVNYFVFSKDTIDKKYETSDISPFRVLFFENHTFEAEESISDFVEEYIDAVTDLLSFDSDGSFLDLFKKTYPKPHVLDENSHTLKGEFFSLLEEHYLINPFEEEFVNIIIAYQFMLSFLYSISYSRKNVLSKKHFVKISNEFFDQYNFLLAKYNSKDLVIEKFLLAMEPEDSSTKQNYFMEYYKNLDKKIKKVSKKSDEIGVFTVKEDYTPVKLNNIPLHYRILNSCSVENSSIDISISDVGSLLAPDKKEISKKYYLEIEGIHEFSLGKVPMRINAIEQGRKDYISNAFFDQLGISGLSASMFGGIKHADPDTMTYSFDFDLTIDGKEELQHMTYSFANNIHHGDVNFENVTSSIEFLSVEYYEDNTYVEILLNIEIDEDVGNDDVVDLDIDLFEETMIHVLVDKTHSKNHQIAFLSHAGFDLNTMIKNVGVSLFFTVGGITINRESLVNEKAAIILIELGADVNQTLQGISPLIFAIENEMEDAVKALLIANADVNFIDSRGAAPLFYAVSNENINIVQYLLDYGADINKAAKDGQSLLEIAKEQDNQELLDLLLKYSSMNQPKKEAQVIKKNVDAKPTKDRTETLNINPNDYPELDIKKGTYYDFVTPVIEKNGYYEGKSQIVIKDNFKDEKIDILFNNANVQECTGTRKKMDKEENIKKYPIISRQKAVNFIYAGAYQSLSTAVYINGNETYLYHKIEVDLPVARVKKIKSVLIKVDKIQRVRGYLFVDITYFFNPTLEIAKKYQEPNSFLSDRKYEQKRIEREISNKQLKEEAIRTGKIKRELVVDTSKNSMSMNKINYPVIDLEKRLFQDFVTQVVKNNNYYTIKSKLAIIDYFADEDIEVSFDNIKYGWTKRSRIQMDKPLNIKTYPKYSQNKSKSFKTKGGTITFHSSLLVNEFELKLKFNRLEVDLEFSELKKIKTMLIDINKIERKEGYLLLDITYVMNPPVDYVQRHKTVKLKASKS